MSNDKSRLVALTGLAFFVLAIIAFLIGGDTPSPKDDSAQEIVDFYVDNEDEQLISVLLEGLAATALVIFAAFLYRVLRDAEGRGGIFPIVAFAGLLTIAIGLAIDATITIALLDTAEDLDPAAAQALSALYNNDFVPMAVGSQVFLIGLGVALLTSGALPKWLALIAILLAIVAVTPIGFVSFIGAGILILIISVMLAMRGPRDAAPAA